MRTESVGIAPGPELAFYAPSLLLELPTLRCELAWKALLKQNLQQSMYINMHPIWPLFFFLRLA